MLEELTGIYEQLTPLQFHFTEKPARFLKSNDCLHFRSSQGKEPTKMRKRFVYMKQRRFLTKIRQIEVNLTKNWKNYDFARKISQNEVNLTKNCARNKSLRFGFVYKGCVNSKQISKIKEGICKICAGFSMK